MCDEGRGVGETRYGVYLDFADAIGRLGEDVIRDRYGNLFEMYERITAENPYKIPMRIYPASHYTMGGLWVDYNLMSTIPGLHVAGEANFSDHGANRLGASALMQGLADGYFVLPYTLGNYLASTKRDAVDTKHAAFREAEDVVGTRIKRLLAVKGQPDGGLLPPRARQDHVGVLRDGAQQGRPRDGAPEDPGAARGVLEERHGRRPSGAS